MSLSLPFKIRVSPISMVVLLPKELLAPHKFMKITPNYYCFSDQKFCYKNIFHVKLETNQKSNILDLRFTVDMAVYSSIADPKLVAQPKLSQNTLF